MTKKYVPPIFVISLKGSERREKMQQQLASFGLDFVFFDAIDGSKTHAVLSHYNDKKRRWQKGYPMTTGEIGCFASHYLLWEKCVALDVPIIVIEDHADIRPNFATVIENFQRITQREGFYKFNSSTASPTRLVETISPDLSIVKFTQKTTATTGYILMPKTAQQLIYHAKDWVEPVDDYMDKEWQHHIPRYGIMPFPMGRLAVRSEIGQRKRKAMPIWVKLRCEILKIPNAIRKYWFLRQLRKLP